MNNLKIEIYSRGFELLETFDTFKSAEDYIEENDIYADQIAINDLTLLGFDEWEDIKYNCKRVQDIPNYLI